MHDPPPIALQFPAAYFAAFALVFLALGVIAVVTFITIAVRFTRLDEHVKRALDEHRDMRVTVASVRDEVAAIRGELGRNPLRIAQSEGGE
jgi:hypothetical protein